MFAYKSNFKICIILIYKVADNQVAAAAAAAVTTAPTTILSIFFSTTKLSNYDMLYFISHYINTFPVIMAKCINF